MPLGCEDPISGSDRHGALFRVSACAGERFTVRNSDPAVIARADDLVGQREQPILSGGLRAGNGGFNQPWSWHLDPDTVAFVDLAFDVCDGCPGAVQRNRDDWLRTGRFCPWTSRVEERVQ